MNTGVSNFDRIMDNYIKNFPEEVKEKGNWIKSIVRKQIEKSNINIKFLNSCRVFFAGVRTKDHVIICNPKTGFGDFIYTIFHEIRHEKQIKEILMPNPLNEFDLEDFETLYDQYWEMELDADQYAKNKVSQIIIKTKIPLDLAKSIFKLSPYIESYPTASNIIKNSLRSIVDQIKIMKAKGEEYTDIQDHPAVKPHIENLESFF